MNLFLKAAAAVVLCLGLAAPAAAQSPEPRLALVLGNTEYVGATAATAANDAGLVAEALRQAGFDVTGAANVDADSLRVAIEDFTAKVGSQGQGGVAFVYFAGRGVQYAGDNYFLPVGAQIASDADIPRFGARISDLTRALSALQLRARIVVLDAARATPMFSGVQIAGGLQFVEADRGSLIAFNAAPGTIAPEEPAPYGTYARAFVELMHEGGVPIEEVFVRTRLRVNEISRGAMIPWHSSKLDQRVVFFEAAADAKPAVSMEQTANIRKRPIRDFSADEAYSVAIERDNLESYQDYVNAYPNAAQARRVRALLAARREARIWRDTYVADTANAYWTYLRRYPRGPHAFDARRRLQIIRASLEPPAQFEVYEYRNVPPPPPEEIVFVERRPVMMFDSSYDLPPPPPPPDYFLPPRRAAFYDLAPPPPAPGYGYLPALGAAAVAVIAAPAIMRALKPVRPQGQYVQPNFGQVRNQQGLVQPGQQGGLQMLTGGQTQQLPPRPNFGGRPQVAPLLPGAGGQFGRPATPGVLPGAGGAQPLPGAGGQFGRPATPGVLPGAGGAQPLPGAGGQFGRPATPGVLPGAGGAQPLPGAGGQFGRPATPGVLPSAGGAQPLPGMSGMGAAAPKPAAPTPAVQQSPAQQRLQQQMQLQQQRQEQQKLMQQQRQQQVQQRQEQQKQMQQQRLQQMQEKRQQQMQKQQQAQQLRQQQQQQRLQQLQQRRPPAAAARPPAAAAKPPAAARPQAPARQPAAVRPMAPARPPAAAKPQPQRPRF
jgi:uncharacterized caspase-like protein